MASTSRRSRLVPWGAALVALALAGPELLLPVAAQAQGTARGLLLLAADLLRRSFFVGLGCLFAGLLRNRSWAGAEPAVRRAAASSRRPAPDIDSQ
jgi:hypothetical protein